MELQVVTGWHMHMQCSMMFLFAQWNMAVQKGHMGVIV